MASLASSLTRYHKEPSVQNGETVVGEGGGAVRRNRRSINKNTLLPLRESWHCRFRLVSPLMDSDQLAADQPQSPEKKKPPLGLRAQPPTCCFLKGPTGSTCCCCCSEHAEFKESVVPVAPPPTDAALPGHDSQCGRFRSTTLTRLFFVSFCPE